MQRKTILACWLLGCFLTPMLSHSEGGSAPLTNEDILRLSEANLPDSVIVAKIQTSESTFDTSVDSLLELSARGVTANVLEAMTNSNSVVRNQSQRVADQTVRLGASKVTNVATNFAGTRCQRPGIFLDTEGSLNPLDITSTAKLRTGSGILSSLTYGIASTKSTAAINGAEASVITQSSKPKLWFCFEEAQAGLSYQTTGAVNPGEFALVKFKVSKKKKERSFEIGKFNLWTGSESGTPPRQLRELEIEMIKPGVYEVTPKAPLEKGQYGFYYTGQKTLTGFGFSQRNNGYKIFAFSMI